MARLILRNTSYLPDTVVRQVYRFAHNAFRRHWPGHWHKLPKSVVIRLENAKAFAYWGNCWAKARLIRMRIGPPHLFPCSGRYRSYENMPDYALMDYQEALVGLVAHELGHFCWRTGKRDDEEACECFALRVLNEYRADYKAIRTNVNQLIMKEKINGK